MGRLNAESDQLAVFGSFDRHFQMCTKARFVFDDVIGRQHDHDRVFTVSHQVGSG